MKPKIIIIINHQYHPDIMVTSILTTQNKVIGAIYDHEIFENGIVEMWN